MRLSGSCGERRSHLKSGLLLLFAVAAATALTCAGRVEAQSIPLVPDPISTPELLKYADIVGLSDQQKIGLIETHDNYKDRYRAFQDREVKKLEDAIWNIATSFMRGAMGGSFSIPPRADIEALIDQYKKVMSGAQAVDRSLFNEMAASLTEDQANRLQRARNSRELANYKDLITEFAGEFNPGAGINLVEMAGRLGLDEQERQQVDPALAEYETGLLSRVKDLYEAMEKGVVAALDFVDESGIRNMTPEQLMELEDDEGLKARAEVKFDDGSKPFQAAAHQLSAFNLRWLRRILPMLSPTNAERLRDRYYNVAYDDLYDGRGNWADRHRRAMDLKAISEDLRATIKAQHDSFISQDDSLIEPLVSAMEQHREYRTFKQMENEDENPLEQRLDETRDRRKALNDSANAALDALLTPELIAQLKEQADTKAEGAQNATGAITLNAGGGRSEARVSVSVSSTSETGLPNAMSLDQFEKAVAMIALDDRAVAQTLYDDYRRGYDELLGKPLTPAEAPASAPDAAPPPHDAAQEAPEANADAAGSSEAKLRAARVDELGAIDAQFFNDLALLAADADQRTRLEWVHHIRQRHAMLSVRSPWGAWGDGTVAAVDPVGLLLETAMTPEQWMPIADAVQTFDERSLTMVQARLDATNDVSRRMEAQQRMMQSSERPNQQTQQYLAQKMQEAWQALNRANRDLAQLNRHTVTQLNSRLPADIAAEYQLKFNRQTNPSVYEDSGSAEKLLQATLSLEDLAPHHREQVGTLLGAFRGEYYAVCDRMVTLTEERNTLINRASGGDFMPNRRDMDREIEMQRLRYERNEASARARLRLRLILPAEQREQLPSELWVDARPNDWND